MSWRRLVFRFTFALTCVAPLCAAAPSVDDEIALGERIYRDGIGADGVALSGIVQGDVPTPAAAACANCHRRSGLGASEGRSRAPAITAPRLGVATREQAASEGSSIRTPYDTQSLHRALTTGMTPDGRTLDALMPRYRMGERDAVALFFYLSTLGAAPDPGVSAASVRLVTIVADAAPAAERQAVVDVITRFARIKNSGTRREQERATASRRQLYGERHIRGFRTWELAVWRLHGAPDSWTAQLERLYAEGPPFVVVSGAAGSDWPVVHRFCERKELPCILPVAPLPASAGDNFYNVYYSDGVRLEARITARELDAIAQHSPLRTLLLHRDDTIGRAARDVLLREVAGARAQSLVVRGYAADAAPTPGDWRALVQRTHPDVIVAWLDDGPLTALLSGIEGLEHGPQRVLTAAQFTDWSRMHPSPASIERVRHVYPYRVAPAGRAAFPRETVWLKSQQLDALSPVPAAQALFACHAVGEAMSDMAGNYSRDYLIESLEHLLDGTLMTTLYPATALGTGQRFLVTGAYVARPQWDSSGPRFTDLRWVTD